MPVPPESLIDLTFRTDSAEPSHGDGQEFLAVSARAAAFQRVVMAREPHRLDLA
jgi:hypothetical protein